MSMKRALFSILVLLCLTTAAQAGDKVNKSWQRAVLAAINTFPDRGGYYTGSRPNELFAKTT